MSVAFGGLASGLDTNSIIDQLMQVEAQPQTRLARRQKVVQARQDLLRNMATQLKNVRSAISTLQSASTWTSAQTINTSDSTKVGASLTGGAGPGGYQVSVFQLARAEQRTYDYTPQGTAGTIGIGSYTYNVAANATIDDVVTGLNSDSASPVYAVKVGTQLVLSARTTGEISTFHATGSSVIEDTNKERPGQDALGSVDNTPFQTSTNTVTTAIPGTSLTLSGVTNSPVTINVGAPGLDKDKVSAAVKSFVDAYNSATTFITSKLKEQRVANPQSDADALKGLLFGDTGLTGMLGQLRAAIANPLTGNPAALDQLAEIGVSTGATTGGATVNPDAVTGLLTFDSSKLASALNNDPVSVRRLLAGDSTTTGVGGRIGALLDANAGTSGVLTGRADSAGREVASMKDQMTALQDRLAAKKKALQAQFTAMETALSNSHNQQSWLTGQINSLGSGR